MRPSVVWQPLFVCISLLYILLVMVLLFLLVSRRGKGREGSCGFSGKVRAEDKSATGAGGDGKLPCWLIERDRTEFSSFSWKPTFTLIWSFQQRNVLQLQNLLFSSTSKKYLLGALASLDPNVGSWPGPKKWNLHHSLLDCRERDRNMDEERN